MKNKSQKKLERTVSRRFIFLSLLKGSIIGTIGWRLFDLQLVENRKYEKLSDDNQFNYRIIPPERGRILDRKMRLLAGNMDGFSLVLNWNKYLNVHQIIKKISNIIILDIFFIIPSTSKSFFQLRTRENPSIFPAKSLIFLSNILPLSGEIT